MSDFVLNGWYMAGWSDELEYGPIARRLLDIPVVIFRTESGAIHALVNRCPHRFAPLSLGRVEGEAIRCGYHGLAFGGDGRCIGSSFGLAIPPGTEVRSFPVVEKDSCIWFWPGEVAQADAATIPDFSYHNDPNFRVVRGVSTINAHFELVSDNLLDLTHTRYLHPGFGGDNWVPEVHFSQEGETLFSHYFLSSTPSSEFSEAYFAAAGEEIFEKDEMRWNAPASMLLTIKMGVVSAPEDVRAVQPSSHILCPETADSSHYFWASGAELSAPVTDEDHFEALRYAFDSEDAPMLEAVHKAMEGHDFWELKPAILAYDNAAIRARRIMRQKLRSEKANIDPALSVAE